MAPAGTAGRAMVAVGRAVSIVYTWVRTEDWLPSDWAALYTPPAGVALSCAPANWPATLNRSSWATTLPSGSRTSRKFVPNGLPVTRWGTAKSAMKPAGGAVPAASHVSQGPTEEG